MPITFNTKTYTADAFTSDAITYIGAAKTVSVADDLKLSRSAPKPTATFSGIARTGTKLSRTLALTGAASLAGNAIVEVNVSVPVGAASADIDALLNDMGALVSGADMKTHVKSAKISY